MMKNMNEVDVIVQLEKVDADSVEQLRQYGMDITYVLDEFNSVSGRVNLGVYKKLKADKHVAKITYAVKTELW